MGLSSTQGNSALNFGLYYNVEQYILRSYHANPKTMAYTYGSVPGVYNVNSIPQPIANPTQGSAVPLQNATPLSVLQGSNPTLQNATPLSVLQGSSPSLQGTGTVFRNLGVTPPPPPPAAPAAPVQTVAAPVLPDRSNSIRNNEAALEGTATQYEGGLSTIQQMIDRLTGKYSNQAAKYESENQESSDMNKNNWLRNTQAALLNAAQGRRGLMGVLGSIGALSGSGVTLANRAVQQGANADISGANDAYGETRTSLNSAIESFRETDKERKEDLLLSGEDARRSLLNQRDTNRQRIFGSLADDYSQMENKDKAREYSDLAAALYSDVARSSIPVGMPTERAANYNAPLLSKYVGGEMGTQVRTAPGSGGSMPGLFAYNPSLRRERED